jgi:hypothetical protein
LFPIEDAFAQGKADFEDGLPKLASLIHHQNLSNFKKEKSNFN